MRVRDLMKHWQKYASTTMTAREFSIKLPVHDAARILALTDMYPARTETQIITELLGAALYELEEAFPYAKGERIITEDEYNDPIYEDVGLTSAFTQKTEHYLHQLEAELKTIGH